MGQQSNKFHVSDDGKIFRINEDGSFTELGNANDLHTPKEEHTVKEPTSYYNNGSIPPPYSKPKSSNTLKYVFFVTGIVILGSLFIWYSSNQYSTTRYEYYGEDSAVFCDDYYTEEVVDSVAY